MNVAVVVLDTLRKDAFDDHFDWLPGRRHERAFSTGNWTVPAHASLFCGRLPGALGVHAKQTTLDCQEQTVAETLSATGYRTRAFSANPNISRPFDFDRGFDQFEGSWRLDGLEHDTFDWDVFIAEHSDEGTVRYLRALQECIRGDCATLPSLRTGLQIKLRDLGLGADPPDDGAQAALSFVESTDFGDEEFLFVNLMEAHAPYAPPEEYRTTDANVDELTTYSALKATIEGGPDADDELLRRAYNDSVRYLSDVYEEIFAELSESFDLIITLGDHGECFGEHGVYQHAYGLYPELTRIPLVVSGADFSGTSDDVVSLLDIHATILDAAGVDARFAGHSLLGGSEQDNRAIVEYHGVRAVDGGKLKSDGLDPAPFDERQLGVAEGEVYGYETREGFTVDGDGDADALRSQVRLHRSEANWRESGETDEISGQIRRQLEDLGYM